MNTLLEAHSQAAELKYVCRESKSKLHSFNQQPTLQRERHHRHLLAPAHNPTPPLQSWTQYDFGCGPSVLEEQGTEEMNFCCVIPRCQAVCEVTSQRASSSKRGSAGPCSQVGQRRLSSGRNAPGLTPSVPRKAAGCGTYQGLCKLLLFSPIWFIGQGTDSVRNRISGKGAEPRASSGVGVIFSQILIGSTLVHQH